MPTKQVNNLEIYYELHGSGEPLVLISGFTEDNSSWEVVIDRFAERFQVLVFDNRGAGRTNTPNEPFTVKDMAQDTISLMKALDISKAHVLGHSMGGAIAQEMALIKPECVDRLVLASTSACFDTLAMFVINVGEKLVDTGAPFEVLLENAFPWLFSASFLTDKENVAKAMKRKLENPYPQTLEGYKNQIKACSQHETLERVAKISSPTLVLTTEKDLLVSPDDSSVLAERIPEASLKILPKMGHMLQFENPALFCDEVTSFLL